VSDAHRASQSTSDREPDPLSGSQAARATALDRLVGWLPQYCAGLIPIAAFMPWSRTAAEGGAAVSGITGIGFVSAAAAVFALLLIYLRPFREKTAALLQAWLAAVTLLAAVAAILEVDPLSGRLYSELVRPGFGLYVTLGAGGVWFLLALIDVVRHGRGQG
jgi:hypothetical protein